MRFSLLVSSFLLFGCGASQFNLHDPYADAGMSSGFDAGVDFDAGTGGAMGGGTGGAMGGGTGGAMGGGTGGAMGGGSGGAMGGGSGGAMGGGTGSAMGGGTGGAMGGGTGGAMGGGTGGAMGGGTGGAMGGGTGGGAATCSAANCASGCCSGGVCQPGTSASACGNGGAACAACAASDSCLPAGVCDLDPASTWVVQPTVAHVDSTVPWDLTSPPDVEMALWCPATRSNYNGLAAKVQDSYDPTWTSGGCTVTAAQLFADGFAFDAIDIDGTGADTITSFTTVPVTAATLRAGTLTGSAGGLDSVTFSFTKQ